MRSIASLVLLVAVGAQTAFAQRTFTGSDGVEVRVRPADLNRIVTVGSAITETVFALGAGSQVIASDQSSSYPAEVFRLTRVPYTRNLTTEGILSVSPGIILATHHAGPETVVRQLRSAGVPFLTIAADETVEAAIGRVRQLGLILGREAQANALIATMEADLARAERERSRIGTRPKVLFIHAQGAGSVRGAGARTVANTMIEMAGGVNALSGFNGYQPLSSEAIIAADPDVILLMGMSLESLGGESGLLGVPGVRHTKAARQNRIIAMEGHYLLGFGPRMGQAVLDLMSGLHPGLEIRSAK